ncbi:sulfate transporter [Salmonella enterica subsp. enterica serovar Newport]|nr:sulfate transporter [Salmonella enterica subsp. enterica serovar Newport]
MQSEKDITVMVQKIPDGYRCNAVGHLVPVDKIKPIDLLRDELVNELYEEARELRRKMAEFKLRTMQRIDDFVDLSASEYGVTYGGTKGNVTLPSFDGSRRVVRATGEHRVFDERIQAAKEMIDACIAEWSDGANKNLIAIVNRSFRVNKQGMIDVNEVLGLRDLDIDDEEWLEAMRAVVDSIKVNGSSTYLRFYQRENGKEYKQLSLDIAKL